MFVVTGSNFSGLVEQSRDWAQSVLAIANRPAGLTLRGTYTPFNYCATAAMDIDLGSGGIALLPPLAAATTTTSRLAVVGGKQGNVYLLDRRRLPGRLDRRPPCSTDSADRRIAARARGSTSFRQARPAQRVRPLLGHLRCDGSGARPLGPCDISRSSDGTLHLFVTGNTKKQEASTTNVPPSLARLKVMTAPGRPAWLAVAQLERTLVFENPGSPVVTSNGSRDPVVWVLDTNARRSALLVGDGAPRPVLHALEAMTLKPLWSSKPGQLHTSGKYNEPTIARGTVFVGTDRIQAFAIGRRPQ